MRNLLFLTDIYNILSRLGGEELLEVLYKDEKLGNNARAKEGLDDMTLLFKYMNVLNVTKHTSFDLSLARGLDYYTGLIYEAVLEGSAPPSTFPCYYSVVDNYP